MQSDGGIICSEVINRAELSYVYFLMTVRASFAWINSSKAHNDKCRKSKCMLDFSQQWAPNVAVYLWLMLRWLCVSVCVWRHLWPVAVQMKCQPVAGSNATLSHSLTLVHCSSQNSLYTTSVCVRVYQTECEWSMSSGYSSLPHNARVSALVQTLWLEETSTIYLLICSRNSKSAKS